MGPYLCDIKDIKLIGRGVLFGHSLHEPVPGWVVTLLDSVVEVVGAMLRVFNTLSDGLCSCEVFDSLACLVVILDVVDVTFVIHPSEGVRRVSINVSVAIRSSAVAEKNGNLVKCFRGETPEIEGHVGILCVVGGITLLAVDKVGELNGIFNEENWRVVSNHVIVAFFSIVLDSEPTRVTITVVCATLTGNSREAEEDWSLFSDLVHELCLAKTKLKRSKDKYLTV